MKPMQSVKFPHFTWLQALQSCPQYVINHLSRLFNIFLRAPLQGLNSVFKVSLMDFSSSTSQTSTAPSRITLLLSTISSPSSEYMLTASSLLIPTFWKSLDHLVMRQGILAMKTTFKNIFVILFHGNNRFQLLKT